MFTADGTGPFTPSSNMAVTMFFLKFLTASLNSTLISTVPPDRTVLAIALRVAVGPTVSRVHLNKVVEGKK